MLATGAAGGAYIMPVDFQIVTNVLDFHLTLQQAVDASRIWGNLDIIMWNPDFPAATLNAMRALGQPIRDTPSFYPQVGAVESLAIDPETFALSGAVDPRGLPEAGATVLPPR